MKGLILIILNLISVATYSQTVSPHSVPGEFASDYYEVKVNGQPVQVFHAGLNVYFASFDFIGNADVKVISQYNSNRVILGKHPTRRQSRLTKKVIGVET